jgi:hypothetical protein
MRSSVFDESERLGENEHLWALLAHYAQPGLGDREAWQDRLMGMAGVRPEDLVKLHGELLACDWIEQNTGTTPAPRPGTVSQCYRVTAAGLRAFKYGQAQRRERAA